MKTMNQCQMCGKSISGGLLCEACEKEMLEKHKGKRYILSGITGIILAGAAYFVWGWFQENRDQVDFSVVYRFYNSSITLGKAILASPYLFIPLVLVLLILAFIIGTKLSK